MTRASRVGILTVSDRASAGVYQDLSGKAIIDTLTEYLVSEWEPVYRLVPYCIDLMKGPYLECNPEVIKAFRPGG